LLAACVALALLGQASLVGQKPDEALPDRFRMFASNLGTVQTTADNRMIEVQVSRWSTDEEEQQMLQALKEKGPRALLNTLQDFKATGWIRTQGSLSYDHRYARQRLNKDGTRNIVVMTDRALAFWELAGSAISKDYPFTVVQLNLKENGKGEGTMTLATKITFEAGILVFEDLSSRPISLLSVTQEK
jgi:hypothetical protein